MKWASVKTTSNKHHSQREGLPFGNHNCELQFIAMDIKVV